MATDQPLLDDIVEVYLQVEDSHEGSDIEVDLEYLSWSDN